MEFVVAEVSPPLKSLSALQLLPRESVYAGPPACTKTGENETAGGKSVTVAFADFVVSAWLVAVTVTACAAVTEAGAVYSPPAVSVPICGVYVQVTAVFVL